MYLPVLITRPDLTISIPALSGDEDVVSYRGYAIPLIEPGQIRFYQHGWICNVRLSNGSFYPLQERHGIIAHDASTHARHGIVQIDANTLPRGLATTDNPLDLHELNVGHNSYFIGQGGGLRISNYPLPVAFTASFLIASAGAEIVLEFEKQQHSVNQAAASIDIGAEAKWLTLRKNNDVWILFLNGERIANVNEAVGQIAGDIDVLIGARELPIAMRRFILWNRALTDAEIRNLDGADADVQWHASSSTRNPVKNLLNELYAGVGQPIICNVPANRDTNKDAYGQPCRIINALRTSILPSIDTPESYNDWRKAVKMDVGQDNIAPKKFMIGLRTKLDSRVSKHEHVRVIEIVK